MFQKFYESTIECKFIKSLLYNVNLPLLNTVSSGDLMIEGMSYVYGNDIIKCTKSGYLTKEVIKCSKTLPCSENLLVGSVRSDVNNAEYTITQPFDFTRYYPQLTERYVPKTSYYDNQTHRFLGNYLRCYRDLYNIDLMPFYNCYNYEIFDDFYLTDTKDGWINEPNSAVKILAVPVKFNKTYTIAVDSSSKVICKMVFHNRFGMLKKTNTSGSTTYLTNSIHDDSLTINYYKGDIEDGNFENSLMVSERLVDPKVWSFNSTSFSKPFTVRIENNDLEFQKMEKYLYLAIQVSASNNSSIVVLEGDYSNNSKKIISVDAIDDMKKSELNKIFISDLSLLRLNTKTIYAFSNRLIEYLLLNVITNRETVRNNIGIVQDKIHFKDLVPWALYDAWDDKLRYELFNKYMSDEFTNKLDINGFVDKDMANYLNKLNHNGQLL